MANVVPEKTTKPRESTDQHSEITITDIEQTDSENDERYVYMMFMGTNMLEFR